MLQYVTCVTSSNIYHSTVISVSDASPADYTIRNMAANVTLQQSGIIRLSVFHTEKSQARHYDRDESYVRRWLPELSALPTGSIHTGGCMCPWFWHCWRHGSFHAGFDDVWCYYLATLSLPSAFLKWLKNGLGLRTGSTGVPEDLKQPGDPLQCPKNGVLIPIYYTLIAIDPVIHPIRFN